MVYLGSGFSVVRQPREFMKLLVWEERTTNHQVISIAEIHKALTIVVHFAQSMPSHYAGEVVVITANLSIQISHNYHNVASRDITKLCTKSTVKFIFFLGSADFGWCIALDNCDVSYFTPKSGNDDSFGHRLPRHQALMCLWRHEETNTSQTFGAKGVTRVEEDIMFY